MSILKLAITELSLIAIGVLLIAGSYIWVLPKFFHDHRTYSVLVMGLVLVAIASGLIARKAGANNQPRGWILVVCVSGAVTVLTLLLSLFFIVNTRGS
jgi:NADH:ubiquinone oxidoreductase subunit 6 (subunit J)